MDERKEIFEGRIIRTLISVSMPIFIGMAADLFYTLSNTFFLAFIDKNSTSIVAGVGLVIPIYFVIIALCQGFFGGMTTLTAVAVGGKTPEKIRIAMNTGLILAILIAALFGAVSVFFGREIMNLLGGSSVSREVLDNGYEYLVWLAPGSFFLTVGHVYLGLAQGIGDTKYVGIALIVSTVFNTALSPMFIFAFGWGIRGAAIGMSLAWVIMLLYLIIVTKNIFRDRKLPAATAIYSGKSAYDLARLGLPQSFGLLALAITAMMLNHFVSYSGEDALNAFVLVNRFDNIIFTPILAIAFGMETMIGQNFGRGYMDRVLKTFRQGTFMTWAVVMFFALIYIVCARLLLGIFTNVERVIEIGARQIYYVTLFMGTGAAIGLCAGSAFQAVMKPLYSFLLVVLRVMVFTLPIAWALTTYYYPSMSWIWISIGTGNILGGIAALIWCDFYLKRLKRKARSVN